MTDQSQECLSCNQYKQVLTCLNQKLFDSNTLIGKYEELKNENGALCKQVTDLTALSDGLKEDCKSYSSRLQECLTTLEPLKQRCATLDASKSALEQRKEQLELDLAACRSSLKQYEDLIKEKKEEDKKAKEWKKDSQKLSRLEEEVKAKRRILSSNNERCVKALSELESLMPSLLPPDAKRLKKAIQLLESNLGTSKLTLARRRTKEEADQLEKLLNSSFEDDNNTDDKGLIESSEHLSPIEKPLLDKANDSIVEIVPVNGFSKDFESDLHLPVLETTIENGHENDESNVVSNAAPETVDTGCDQVSVAKAAETVMDVIMNTVEKSQETVIVCEEVKCEKAPSPSDNHSTEARTNSVQILDESPASPDREVETLDNETVSVKAAGASEGAEVSVTDKQEEHLFPNCSLVPTTSSLRSQQSTDEFFPPRKHKRHKSKRVAFRDETPLPFSSLQTEDEIKASIAVNRIASFSSLKNELASITAGMKKRVELVTPLSPLPPSPVPFKSINSYTSRELPHQHSQGFEPALDRRTASTSASFEERHTIVSSTTSTVTGSKFHVEFGHDLNTKRYKISLKLPSAASSYASLEFDKDTKELNFFYDDDPSMQSCQTTSQTVSNSEPEVRCKTFERSLSAPFEPSGSETIYSGTRVDHSNTKRSSAGSRFLSADSPSAAFTPMSRKEPPSNALLTESLSETQPSLEDSSTSNPPRRTSKNSLFQTKPSPWQERLKAAKLSARLASTARKTSFGFKLPHPVKTPITPAVPSSLTTDSSNDAVETDISVNPKKRRVSLLETKKQQAVQQSSEIKGSSPTFQPASSDINCTKFSLRRKSAALALKKMQETVGVSSDVEPFNSTEQIESTNNDTIASPKITDVSISDPVDTPTNISDECLKNDLEDNKTALVEDKISASSTLVSVEDNTEKGTSKNASTDEAEADCPDVEDSRIVCDNDVVVGDSRSMSEDEDRLVIVEEKAQDESEGPASPPCTPMSPPASQAALNQPKLIPQESPNRSRMDIVSEKIDLDDLFGNSEGVEIPDILAPSTSTATQSSPNTRASKARLGLRSQTNTPIKSPVSRSPKKSQTKMTPYEQFQATSADHKRVLSLDFYNPPAKLMHAVLKKLEWISYHPEKFDAEIQKALNGVLGKKLSLLQVTHTLVHFMKDSLSNPFVDFQNGTLKPPLLKEPEQAIVSFFFNHLIPAKPTAYKRLPLFLISALKKRILAEGTLLGRACMSRFLAAICEKTNEGRPMRSFCAELAVQHHGQFLFLFAAIIGAYPGLFANTATIHHSDAPTEVLSGSTSAQQADVLLRALLFAAFHNPHALNKTLHEQARRVLKVVGQFELLEGVEGHSEIYKKEGVLLAREIICPVMFSRACMALQILCVVSNDWEWTESFALGTVLPPILPSLQESSHLLSAVDLIVGIWKRFESQVKLRANDPVVQFLLKQLSDNATLRPNIISAMTSLPAANIEPEVDAVLKQFRPASKPTTRKAKKRKKTGT